MKSYSPYLAILKRIEIGSTSELLRSRQLSCETGDWLDSAVLKLQKKAWIDGGFEQGVFFSVWIGDKELQKHRFHYNIHVLNLSLRKGFSIKPVEFAAAFRTRIEPFSRNWPNLRTDFGPQILIQGCQPPDLSTFHSDVLVLMDRFVAIHGIIDEMLEERRVRKSPR